MTDIAFHFNVGQTANDKLIYVCRLLRKAVAAKARVFVLADAQVLATLDQMLWTFSPLEFISHSRVGISGAPEHMTELSAVILGPDPAHSPHQEVLVNLLSQVPSGFETFARVIEVVSLAEPDRQEARLRWRRYAELGFGMTKHDIALQGGKA